MDKQKKGISPFSLGLIPLFVLAHFSHHVLTALTVPLMPFIRDSFHLDYTQSGWVVSAFTLSYGMAQLPSGWLADRLDTRKLITLGISGVAAAGLLVGLSQTYVMMICCLVLMGALGGGYHPSAPPLISQSVELEKRGRALGYHNIGGSGSYFLTPIIGVAIANALGWRSSYIILAIPTIIIGLVLYVLIKKHTVKQTIDGASSPSATAEKQDGRPAGNNRRLTAFIILSTFTSAVIGATCAFIPLYLVDHFKLSEAQAGLYLALIFSTGVWMNPIGGYLSDRFGSIPVILTICFLAGPFIFLLNIVPNGPAIIILLLGLGIIMSVRMPTSELFIVGETSARNRSTILGIYYFTAMEAGGILNPVMGRLIDRFGFYTSFTSAAVFLFCITLVCAFFLKKKSDDKGRMPDIQPS
ncbi:MAG: MFS transporter [Deltaproteobacteria bacterium]|nr:MFS transporter [Deltaproteobacteria bacterium]